MVPKLGLEPRTSRLITAGALTILLVLILEAGIPSPAAHTFLQVVCELGYSVLLCL